VLNAGRYLDHNGPLEFLSTDAPTPITRISDNLTITLTPGTGSDIGEATENALLDSADLAAPPAFGTLVRACTRPTAAAVALRAILDSGYADFFFNPKGGFFQRNGKIAIKVSPLNRSMSGSRRRPTAKESIEDATHAVKAKSLEAATEIVLTAMSEPVIGTTLIRVREHLVGFVYFLELLFSSVGPIVIGVVLEGHFAESLLYLISVCVLIDAENLIIVPF
jgi:hypothetical protein|tara:strand:- start:589 stop:1254 length:666 start_codon:yes stop_codon:yes gene_type:complete